MEDLIRRSDAIKGAKRLHNLFLSPFYNRDRVEMIEAYFNDIPSADRPQGEWKPFDLTWGRSIYACSVCEEAIAVPCGWSDGKPIYDYCPMCGARMKGADDEVLRQL